jgi:hypothetical protein
VRLLVVSADSGFFGARPRTKDGGARSDIRVARTVVLLCGPLAAFSKQTGILLPILLLVSEVFVPQGPTHRGQVVVRLLAVLSFGLLAAGTLRVVWDPAWILEHMNGAIYAR